MEQPRREPRIGRSTPISFSSDRFIGKGRLINLSTKGCAFMTDYRLEKGETFGVRIHAPGEHGPIEVGQAIVRWAATDKFGLEFLEMGIGEQKKLQALLD